MTARFNASATPDEVKAFDAACARVGDEHTDVIRLLAAAYVAFVNETGVSVRPIKIAGMPAKK